MYCDQCGQQNPEDAAFCQWCGQKIEYPVQKPAGENKNTGPADPLKNGQPPPAPQKNFWLWPLAAAIFMVLLLGGYAFYELQYVNRLVTSNLAQAEKLALDGEITEARHLVERSLQKRPRYEVLYFTYQLLQRGEELQGLLQNAITQGQQKNYEQAASLINQAEKLAQGEGAFYEMLQEKIKEEKIALSVIQVKQEINEQKTLEELIGLLHKVSAYEAQEATALAQVVRDRIGDTVYTMANELIGRNNFSGAQELVEQGLHHAGDSKKLLSLKNTIAKERLAFEEAEQKRLAQAQAAALQEASINLSSAVELLTLDSGANDYGDFILQGHIKNIATRPIFAVEIYYTVYDGAAGALTSGSTFVYPNYLYPGDEGYFDEVIYGLMEGQDAEITKTTWYLN